MNAAQHDVEWWAASGLMMLTGPPTGEPLGPPAGLRGKLDAVTSRIATSTVHVGTRVELDGALVLAERAALLGLRRGGRVSCGGSTRLLDAGDGHVALSLARADDVQLVPALVERDDVAGTDWEVIERHARAIGAAAFVERARMLGLAAAALPPAGTTDGVAGRVDGVTLPVRTEQVTADRRPRGDAALRVVDLTSLWAGPLCTSVLAAAGADVVKLESAARPDGGREGSRAFFDLLNGGKSSVRFDHRTATGRARVEQLIRLADVVVDAARPRVLEQWGIDRRALVGAGHPRVWVSITAYDRQGPAANAVGFGDDAAIAGGLVANGPDGPSFCADAVADPLTGLVAAASALEAAADGGAWLIDVALADVAAHFAGPTVPVDGPVVAAAPRARPVTAQAAPLGAHDAEVVERWTYQR